MKMKTLIFALIALGFMTSARASVIAIIDSGTALDHQELKEKKWSNPKDIDDAVDNDDNGYIDDVNGWNFAEGNNKLYDKTLLGTFSADTSVFFEVQTRMIKGEASAEDLAWLKQKIQDKKFIAELQVFGNFVHGTHVAGIAAKGVDEAKIMGLKIIPTKAPSVGGGHKLQYFGNLESGIDPDKLIRMGLKVLASQQAKQLQPIGAYVAKQKARLANCSFGTSTNAAKGVLKPLLAKILKRDPTPEELETYAIFFVNEVTKAAEALVKPAPNTLFVIAAGNDGMDNDRFPTSPANIKRDNTLTVAATYGYKRLASFSNYGATMVDVAAPGVGILSTIPGNQYLTVNGTSQAAPFVTGVAGMMLDANPALSNSDVKAILMGTSDAKDFLKGRVVSGGVVNPTRAVAAARLSTSMQVKEAIEAARAQVNDVVVGFSEKKPLFDGFALPLPSLFQ
jgi:subtilisin family serine protease